MSHFECTWYWSKSPKISEMILEVFSSLAAMRTSSCSNGAIKALFDGAKFKLANVSAANFEIFSSLCVSEPEEMRPMSRSMHRCYAAILTLSDVVVSLSEMVQRISKQPSLVSTLGLIRRFTRF